MIDPEVLRPQFHESWYELLKNEFAKDYFQGILLKIKQSIKDGETVRPRFDDIFLAYRYPKNKTLVVILGQDPYYSNHADGLAFSTKLMQMPESLVSIYKEIYFSLFQPIMKGIDMDDCFCCGDLRQWADQGVMLLNPILTSANVSMAHKDWGWQQFTRYTISLLNEHEEPIVFMLWGKVAKDYRELIDESKHFIFEANHPAAEAYNKENAFQGCGHFKQCNEALKSRYNKEINWGIWPTRVPWYNFTVINPEWEHIDRLKHLAIQEFRIPAYLHDFFVKAFGNNFTDLLHKPQTREPILKHLIQVLTYSEPLKKPKKDREWIYDEDNFLWWIQNLGSSLTEETIFKISIERP